MFSLRYTEECELVGKITVSKPIHSLGNVTDINGREWNIHAIYNNIVQACPKDKLHPYYTDTSGATFGIVQQKWLPYEVVVTTRTAQTG